MNPIVFRAWIFVIATPILGCAFSSATQSLSSEKVLLSRQASGRILVEVTMEFAGVFPARETFFFPEGDWFEYADFQVFQNGDALSTSRHLAPDNSAFFLGDKPYPAVYLFHSVHSHISPTFKITYSFRPPFYSPGTKNVGPSGLYVEYILNTGKPWGSKVDSLIVSFDSTPVPCATIHILRDSAQGHCVSEFSWNVSQWNKPLPGDIRLLLPQ
ncbi:MAG: hypothetical protein JNM27_03470 [Leptospirales bacterium]|nr:hypothetical protein [Leptospirales bacterium]